MAFDINRCDQVWSRCLPIGDKLPGGNWRPVTSLAPRLHYRDFLGLDSLSNTFPIISHQCNSLSSCWTSTNEGLPKIIEKIDMKAVWVLLLLCLSQADTYLGRGESSLGLKKALSSRQESSGAYSWPWLLGRQSSPRRRPSTLESLGLKLRGLLGFNPRGVKSINKRTLRLRLPTIAPLRLRLSAS